MTLTILSALAYLLAGCLILLIAITGSRSRSTLQTDHYRSKTLPSEEGGSNGQCFMGDRFTATIGISILNLCDLDLSSKTFYAEGMVWLKYAVLPTWLDHWGREIIEAPVRALRFVNNVDRHDLSLELEPALPVQDADGLNIQWLKFSGRFAANDLNLRMFPFETLHLPIEVELEDLYASETNLTYEPSGSLLATGGDLSGYRIIRTAVTQAVHNYSTNWGWKLAVSCNGAENLAEFDNIRTELVYDRSTSSSLPNIFLPLAVMMCVVLTVPLIDIQQHENRVVIPASALLVLVFLQEGYKKILPAGLNYPTLADLIYSSCFISTIGIFLWSVASANLFLESSTANQPSPISTSRVVSSSQST